MTLTEIVAIFDMFGSFWLIPLILWFLKSKPVRYPQLEPQTVPLRDFRVIKLRAKV